MKILGARVIEVTDGLATLKEAVDAGRSRYLAERVEHARQASRAAEHEAPRAQRSVER